MSGRYVVYCLVGSVLFGLWCIVWSVVYCLVCGVLFGL